MRDKIPEDKVRALAHEYLFGAIRSNMRSVDNYKVGFRQGFTEVRQEQFDEMSENVRNSDLSDEEKAKLIKKLEDYIWGDFEEELEEACDRGIDRMLEKDNAKYEYRLCLALIDEATKRAKYLKETYLDKE